MSTFTVASEKILIGGVNLLQGMTLAKGQQRAVLCSAFASRGPFDDAVHVSIAAELITSKQERSWVTIPVNDVFGSDGWQMESDLVAGMMRLKNGSLVSLAEHAGNAEHAAVAISQQAAHLAAGGQLESEQETVARMAAFEEVALRRVGLAVEAIEQSGGAE